MIRTIYGKVGHIYKDFFVFQVGAVGFKVFAAKRTMFRLSNLGKNEVLIFCHFRLKEDGVELFGFLDEGELQLFELLVAVSGIGPKSAINIMDVASPEELLAAISEGKADLLTRASGVGRKTAERAIVELRGKVQVRESAEIIRKMSDDQDIVETLVSLGYRKDQARGALTEINKPNLTVEERLRTALKILGKRK